MREAGSQRIAALDVLRGVAVLGILLMNIQSFSMIESAYLNPTSYGDFSGVNYWVWALNRLFSDQKFMTLFSLLFGAGIVLMSEKAEANGRRPAAAHYRRMGVLLAAGLAHAYLFWYGDVLTTYALCGLVVYLARRWRPKVLFCVGAGLMLVTPAIFGLVQAFLDYYPANERAELESMWRPSADEVSWELEVYRGSYGEQLAHRVPTVIEFHVQVFLLWFVWRVSGLMLIGMALYKWKVLSGYRSAGFYRRMVMAGLGIGLTVEGFGMYYMEAAGWPVEVMIPGLITNYFSSLFTAGGYIGLVMLMHQSGWWAGLKGKLAAVGRMAFTNYLAQTLICTTIFYGHGFGLFGHVERWQQVLLVGAVWVLQIYWSKLWLERYQAGPLEWLWRCVTYLRVMPLRRREEVGTVEPPVLRV